MTVLGDFATVVDCEHRTAPESADEPFGFSVGTGAVRNGRISIDRAKPVSEDTYLSWTRRATPTVGDLIFSREAPMGEVGAVLAGVPLCLGQRTVLLRPNPALVDHRFLMYALMAPPSQGWIARNSAGSTVLHLNVADVRKIPMPVLPVLDEQRRIVEFLDSHLSRLDAGAASAKKCLRRKESLRMSLLAENYIGQPTSLGQLSVEAGYGTSTKCEVGGPGVPVVRIPNLVGGFIDLSDEKRAADSDLDLSKYMLKPGDLLIVRTNGSVDLIGRAAVVQPGIEAAFASYLIRYRLNTAQVRPRWVSAVLSSPQVRNRLESLAASSAGQHNLSLGKLDSIELPVPTLDVQDARLRRLDAIESDIARLTIACNQLLAQEAILRMSILTAAFSGRLTSFCATADTGIESA